MLVNFVAVPGLFGILLGHLAKVLVNFVAVPGLFGILLGHLAKVFGDLDHYPKTVGKIHELLPTLSIKCFFACFKNSPVPYAEYWDI